MPRSHHHWRRKCSNGARNVALSNPVFKQTLLIACHEFSSRVVSLWSLSIFIRNSLMFFRNMARDTSFPLADFSLFMTGLQSPRSCFHHPAHVQFNCISSSEEHSLDHFQHFFLFFFCFSGSLGAGMTAWLSRVRHSLKCDCYALKTKLYICAMTTHSVLFFCSTWAS